jgi:2-hydroxy-3-keto-5-methylthiopentenyl-1-phosphate phosphatase
MVLRTAASPATGRYTVFVDFDGMIAPGDATDALLARFADPSWRQIEARWQSGEIASIECMARQVDLLRATPCDIARFAETVRIDPHFPAFLRLCRLKGAEVTIVSDGLDLVVGSVLRRAGLEVTFYANELQWIDDDRWVLRFPFARRDCPQRMGNCKCAHRRSRGALPSIMVGDGRSDFCLAEKCTFVLAKGALAAHCRKLQLPHVEIADFADARRVLAQWFRRQLARCHVDGGAPARNSARIRPHAHLKRST